MSALKIRAALEAALSAMTGIMAITSSSVATSTVITTATAHGLASESLVSISGHTGSTPAIDGIHKVTVTSTTTFTIPVAVTVAGTGGAWTATAWENLDFTPPSTSTAYQSVHLLFAEPDNMTYGSSFQELGIMQVDLKYPQQVGPAAAYTRAELLRTTFHRGASFSSGGVTTTVLRTPEIMPGRNEDGRYVLPVRIRFIANVTV